jgi:hypothetical protein
MKCPYCGRIKCVSPTDRENVHFCGHCKVYFDDDPEEGGDYYTDPSRRMENAEQWGRKREKRH